MEDFGIAAVQANPVYFDRDATIEKACGLIAEAAKGGANLAVFPEAFVSGYPVWVWFVPASRNDMYAQLFAELHANALTVPGPETDRLCEAAREANITVAIGINERNTEASNATIFNTLLYIGNDGTLLGKHRKLMPTAAERMVWGMGDGSDLETYDQPFGKLGGLLCWENYMPLARYAMWAWGTQIYVAPTWDQGETWLATMQHIAKEGRAYVIGCCSPMHQDDLPNRLEFKKEYLKEIGEWLNQGDSVIVNPEGNIVAGPAKQEETILHARATQADLTGPHWMFDPAGHYARPDVFNFSVNRSPKPLINPMIPQQNQNPPTQKPEETAPET